MKIMIIGSMAFAKDMMELKAELEKHGHTAQVPTGIEPHLTDDNFVDSLEANRDFCIKHDVMRKCFQQIVDSDAVLLLNKERKGIKGYIGASALMELGIAHYFKKKIFVWEKLPSYDQQRWVQEVEIMQPIIIDSNILKII